MARDDISEAMGAVQTAPETLILPVDCRQGMRLCLAPKSVHMVVTSPPYFGLRNYDHPDQLGQEQTPEDYVAALVSVFDEVWRVLRDDGTVWLNIGDRYANDRKWGGASGGKHAGQLHGNSGIGRGKVFTGLKSKELIGIPWMVAFALRARGWYLRQDIIWSKPNPMPESVTDRCTKAHEYLFLLTKSPRYFFDNLAIMEGLAASSISRLNQNVDAQAGSDRVPGKTNGRRKAVGGSRRRGVPPYHAQYASSDQSNLDSVGRGNGRNRRSVWTVTTKPFKGAHFATFPPDLIEPCILAGSPVACCATCGAPRLPVYEKTPMVIDRSERADKAGIRYMTSGQMISPATAVLMGYKPSCPCTGGGSIPATVLDPFGGAGTTALVSRRLGRSSVSFDINAGYCEMAQARLEADKA